jgi:hypothetical protein
MEMDREQREKFVTMKLEAATIEHWDTDTIRRIKYELRISYDASISNAAMIFLFMEHAKHPRERGYMIKTTDVSYLLELLERLEVLPKVQEVLRQYMNGLTCISQLPVDYR